MRIFALELDNDIKGIEERKRYIEGLISRLPSPDLVVLPELALPSYMASPEIWKYADENAEDTSEWALATAEKYNTAIGTGYLERRDGDYYNRYMIVTPDGISGSVTKGEGESAVFKRGDFPSTIETPFGTVAVAICYDSRRRRFYENVKDKELSLILFPHGSPGDPGKTGNEKRSNDRRCSLYSEAFSVPVVYVNSTGSLPGMPGTMGGMMKRRGFRLNGLSHIYAPSGRRIESGVKEAVALEVDLSPRRRVKDIRFYGEDIEKGNFLFRHFILKRDTERGIRYYRENNPGNSSLAEATEGKGR